MRINNNIMAMNTYRMYNLINQKIQTSMERLSTGLRINRAADDPAGLAISEKMRAQIRGMQMASKNAQDAISLVQTAEGALQESQNIIHRLRELALQAASDTNETSIDRAALNAEYQQLLAELDDTAKQAVFNDQPLLNGKYASSYGTLFDGVDNDIYARFFAGPNIKDGQYTFSIAQDGGNPNLIHFTLTDSSGKSSSSTIDLSAGPYDKDTPITLTFHDGTSMSFKFERDANATDFNDIKELIFGGASTDTIQFEYKRNGMTIQTGPNQGDELRISIDAMNTTRLGIAGTDISSREAASSAIGKLDRALNIVSTQRSQLGAMQNRLSHKINNLENSIINLSEAESRIRDVDYARELSELVRNQIQMQFAIAMMAQANLMPQNVLKLLGM